MSLPPDLKSRVLAAAQAEPSPTRAEQQKKALQIAAAGVVASMVVFFGTGGPDAGHRAAGFFALSAIALALLSIAATFAALPRLRKTMTGAPTDVLVWLTIVAAPSVWIVEMALRTIWPQFPVRTASVQSTLICHACTLGMAVGPLLALLVLHRRSDAVHPAASGAAFGAVAGLWGALLIDLHCASNDLVHIALAHALPVLLLAAVGALLGRRMLATAPST